MPPSLAAVVTTPTSHHAQEMTQETPFRLIAHKWYLATQSYRPSISTSVPSCRLKNQRSLLHILIKHQLNHNLRPLTLRMHHHHLHRPPHTTHNARRTIATRPAAPIVQALNLPSSNNLLQAAILRIANLHKIRVKEDEVRSIERNSLRSAHKLHNDRARDLAVLVDVDGAVGVAE